MYICGSVASPMSAQASSRWAKEVSLAAESPDAGQRGPRPQEPRGAWLRAATTARTTAGSTLWIIRAE